MWLKARDTLARLAELGARHGVMFVLENLKMPKSTIRAYHSAVPPIAWP